MKRENVIPLTQEWILNPEIYYILQIFNSNLEWIDYDAAREDFIWFKLTNPLRCGTISRTNWYNKCTLLDKLNMPQKSDFLCLMPKNTFNLLYNSINRLTTREQSTIVRVFVYLYYYSMWTTNGWYSHSREDAAADLHMNQARFSSAVKFLEEHGFLARGNYLIGLEARRYYIPPFLWTEECTRYNERKK